MPKVKKQDRITHLSRVVFEGYKSIDHLEIDLVKGLNIIIGPNGSGKSNFLELLDSLLKKGVLLPWMQQPLHNSSDIMMITIGNRELRLNMERKVKLNASSYINRLRLSLGRKLVYDSNREKENKIARKKGVKVDLIAPSDLGYALHQINVSYPNIILIKYNLPDSLIAIDKSGSIKIDKKNNVITTIDSSTDMLTSLFMNFIFNDNLWKPPLNNLVLDKEYILNKLKLPQAVKNSLRKFSPIKDIRISPNLNIYEDENRASIENIILDFFVEGQWVPWSWLSDGTKRLFYLISEISYFDNAIILIEEPELGVHPDQFYSIMDFLKEQAEDKQIIMSTHSPEALNILDENELGNIIVTKYDKKKGTTMSHLGKKQMEKARAYMKELDLSDYWLSSDLEA
jgi:predicted ATP-dependent endonuclease of OLD family